jgi:hypothetical protein
MHILVAYFSYTSHVETLARMIESQWRSEHEVLVAPIVPVRNRPYWNWLLRSFLPGSKVATRPIPATIDQFDRVCLGFPKWTLSCPPLNDYLSRLPDQQKVPLGLFMSFGGFDEDRYLEELGRRTSKKGRLAVTLAVKRRLIRSPAAVAAVDSFCRALISPGPTPVRLKVDVTREPA